MAVKVLKYKRLCCTNRFSNCQILAFVYTDSSWVIRCPKRLVGQLAGVDWLPKEEISRRAAYYSLSETVPRCGVDKVAVTPSMESNCLCFHSQSELHLRLFLRRFCISAHGIDRSVGYGSWVPSWQVWKGGNVAPCGSDGFGHRPHGHKEEVWGWDRVGRRDCSPKRGKWGIEGAWAVTWGAWMLIALCKRKGDAVGW